MDLDELRAFIAVVETGSFSAAAKSLRFARATLRRRIDELEARIGQPLLERDEGRVRPTVAGAVLVERGASVLREARTLLESLRHLDRQGEHEIHLVGLPGPPPELMVSGMRALSSVVPNVRVRLWFDEDPTQLPAGLPAIGLDIAHAAPVGDFRVRALASVPVRLYGTPELVARKPVRTLGDLESHTIVAWRNREGPLDHLVHRDGTRTPIRPLVVTSDLSLLSAYAAAEIALVYAPEIPPIRGRGARWQPVLDDVVGHSVVVRLLVSERASRGGVGEVVDGIAAIVTSLMGTDRI